MELTSKAAAAAAESVRIGSWIRSELIPHQPCTAAAELLVLRLHAVDVVDEFLRLFQCAEALHADHGAGLIAEDHLVAGGTRIGVGVGVMGAIPVGDADAGEVDSAALVAGRRERLI